MTIYRIAARSLQGIGGSGLYSLAQVCLVEQGPNRPEIVGALVGVTLSISYILGPLLGGQGLTLTGLNMDVLNLYGSFALSQHATRMLTRVEDLFCHT